MNFDKITVKTLTQGIDLLCAQLTDIGVTGFEIQDADDFKSFLDEKAVPWDYVDESLMSLESCETTVSFYLAKNEQGENQFAALKALLDKLRFSDEHDLYGDLTITVNEVAEEDWANNWKQYFKPIKIGEKIIIKPSWETLSDEDRKLKVIEIDPGSSFGTGQHETTRLCLELMQKYITGGEKVLDMGCGSGILSIGTLLLGAGSVCAVDIDQNASDIARENLRQNGFGDDRVAVFCGNILDDASLEAKIAEIGKYDLICANIVADVLCAMSPIFARIAACGAVLIASGIIGERVNDVSAAFEKNGFSLLKKELENDWCALVLKKS